jgi:chemotaxis protein methyltransferase CheR
MILGHCKTLRLDDDSFRTIAELAYRESGLTLVPQKAAMIQSRLRPRLHALGVRDFSQYATLLASDAGRTERQELISALTTNVSHFFREQHHFEILCQQVARRMPFLEAGGRMRIWSAGCANGQETVSAAIALLERFPGIQAHDLRILGTDIDRCVIRFARIARYPARMLDGLPAGIRLRHFTRHEGDDGDPVYEVSATVKRMIRYNELNILGPWPMRHGFDVVFCRNMVIYFDAPTQNSLWPRLRQVLHQDGLLFLGHSERIGEPARFGFEMAGATTYRAVAS